jgi:hypothetical protein
LPFSAISTPLGVRLGVSARGLDRIFVRYRLRKATYVPDAVDAASTEWLGEGVQRNARAGPRDAPDRTGREGCERPMLGPATERENLALDHLIGLDVSRQEVEQVG